MPWQLYEEIRYTEKNADYLLFIKSQCIQTGLHTYVSKYLRNQGNSKACQQCSHYINICQNMIKKVAPSKKQKAERNITFRFNEKCNKPMHVGVGRR